MRIRENFVIFKISSFLEQAEAIQTTNTFIHMFVTPGLLKKFKYISNYIILLVSCILVNICKSTGNINSEITCIVYSIVQGGHN